MFIYPHAHMISRTTDDYDTMAHAGVVAVIEPFFFGSASRAPVSAPMSTTFLRFSGFEKFRAGQFDIRHYCCIGLNPKEANDETLADAVLDVLPHFVAGGQTYR